MQKYIQSYISNISFNKSLEEIVTRYYEFSELTSLDPIFNEKKIEWTSPKWIKNEDIVFFMFSKTSIDTIHHLKKVFFEKKSDFSITEQEIISNSIMEGENKYQKFGGCIFAIGRIDGTLIQDNFSTQNDFHWKGRIYAPITDIKILERPIHISEFNSFILVSRQSSITPLFGKNFDDLKKIIIKYNNCSYLNQCESCSVPLSKVNVNNWYEIVNQYRRNFFLESQFREFFVNYFLPIISDEKRYYKECPCVKIGKPTTYVDNLIWLDNKYLPVEVKLNILTEKNLINQCKQYCSLDDLYFTKVNGKKVPIEKVYSKYVLIIDTSGCFVFSEKENTIINLINFDEISNLQELKIVRNKIIDICKTV